MIRISKHFNHYQKPIKFTNPDVVVCDYNRNTFFCCIAKVSIGCRADTKKRNMELLGWKREWWGWWYSILDSTVSFNVSGHKPQHITFFSNTCGRSCTQIETEHTHKHTYILVLRITHAWKWKRETKKIKNEKEKEWKEEMKREREREKRRRWMDVRMFLVLKDTCWCCMSYNSMPILPEMHTPKKCFDLSQF